MNQALLTRLFKSIEGNQNSPLMKIAFSIIEDEKNRGHSKLASKLETILETNKKTPSFEEFKVVNNKDFKIPVDRRFRLPLATHVEHDSLRHHMILDEGVESKVTRIEKEYLAKDRLALHGLVPRKKILLYGSSGCGKSMAAERIAWDLGLPFYRVRFDSIISSYLGESASNLNKLFESLEEYPCVLLLDEFDIIGKQRNLGSNDVGEINRIVNVLLGLLEEYNGDGILIATTNLEGSLDKALFRRFDDLIEFPKPSKKQIIELLTTSFSALPIKLDVNIDKVSEKMNGLSYAIIVKITNDTAKKAIISLKESIQTSDLMQVIEENENIN